MSNETKAMLCAAVEALEEAVDNLCWAYDRLYLAGDKTTAAMCVPLVTSVGEVMKAMRDRVG